MSLAEELAARAAASTDSARRFTREHTMAVTLQRSLLPQALPEQNAVEVAHRYLPAEAGQDRDGCSGTPSLTGATCLYAIYGPVSRLCTMARAGHLEPILVHPDGQAHLPGVPAGPPLGPGGLPYENTEVLLPEGSSIVLYTDGLIEDRRHDIDEGIERLRGVLATAGGTPDQMCQAAMDAMLPVTPRDDMALLVARTRQLDEEHTAAWDVPTDPAAVAGVRAGATRLLRDWGMEEEAAFTLELILSELVTNAIRYATGPIGVRLIHDRTLICEVSDDSDVSPHPRRATTMDEGGRVSSSWPSSPTAGALATHPAER